MGPDEIAANCNGKNRSEKRNKRKVRRKDDIEQHNYKAILPVLSGQMSNEKNCRYVIRSG
ncbi:hypothetical protein C5167_019120 [Papaver somniferum]|uniref:Uncharacterized protein n=1 Tax=Papaver somniferum TaxID=3469 RepID=A0A4Y7IPA2_PAPSO|nr:hypothetical protein C5167_019120 [Papaver somniferum]